MNEDEWLAQVEAGHPHGGFGHREHLRLARLALEREPDIDAAIDRVCAAVRSIAARHGRPQRYNRTVTDAWVRIIAHCRRQDLVGSFDDMLVKHPWLFDNRLLLRHYSSRVLASAAAREASVEPDVLPIPG